VLIQRFRLFWRSSLSIADIEKKKNYLHCQTAKPGICFVDNRYGELIADREPTAVGADLMAGSLIKNPLECPLSPLGGLRCWSKRLGGVAIARQHRLVVLRRDV